MGRFTIYILFIMATAGTVGCGNTQRASSDSAAATVATVTATSTSTSTYTYTDDETTETTATTPPLSYEFTLKGNQVAATPKITTDGVLKVKFRVTADQGNTVHSASELAVTLAMNGTEVTPQYTSSNYVYGQVGETSNVIDLSSYVSAGAKVQITVKNPKNDFYCTYWGGYYYSGGVYTAVNPLYNVYPGCRKAVASVHNWSGVIIVQTSSTEAI